MPAGDVEAFLAAVPDEVRAALEQLRKRIRAVLPEAIETISYGVPTFKQDGRPVVGFGASKGHCALYVMSPKVMEDHAADLQGYDTSKGTIRFLADKALLATLVKKLVKARLAENEAKASGYGSGRPPSRRVKGDRPG